LSFHVSQRYGIPADSTGAKSSGLSAQLLIFANLAGMTLSGEFCFFPGTEFENLWVVFQKCCPFSLVKEDELSNSAGGIIL